MPWCEPCSKFFNPGSEGEDGTCPDCGARLDADHQHSEDPLDGELPVAAKVPWHFWVGVTAMVIYLGWRLIQGIIWAIG